VTHLAKISRAEAAVANELLADGAGNREIADRLGLVEDTVKSHVKGLLEAAECETRTEFVARVLRGRVHLRVMSQPGRRARRPSGDPLCAEAGAAR
jgi:DNA-binding NarL/FixJ family response regulator